MKTISLCMIIKDGAKYIEACLSSVAAAVSEMVLVDTGSTDGTQELVRRFNPRVFQYEWCNRFDDARNFSLSQATGDYILVLDADEVLCAEDLPKLTECVETSDADGFLIRFMNLTDENNLNIFNTHVGLRLFKNGAYHFEGAIHEQPVLNTPGQKAQVVFSGVSVRHYGYLKSNAGIKKFNRNMAILTEELKKHPGDAFHLFNIGNQYLSAGDYKTALLYFNKADKTKNPAQAYSPHLYYRRASCLKTLGKGEECLRVIAEGLFLYPVCTDLEYLRGLTLTGLKRYSLALDSFERCVSMDPAPPSLSFLPGTGGVEAWLRQAEIYNLMEDYGRAYHSYAMALTADHERFELIYKIAGALNRLHEDKTEVHKKIDALFADSRYKPNVMVTTDALLNEKIYEEAERAFREYDRAAAADDGDLWFLQGRLRFYEGDYRRAYECFEKMILPGIRLGVLPDVKRRSYAYLTTCGLLCGITDALPESDRASVYQIFFVEEDTPSERPLLGKESYAEIKAVLTLLLSVGAYDLFENALRILNCVDGNESLLWLADIYHENGFTDMAVQTIFQSIKELDAFGTKAAEILYRAY